MSSIYKEHTMKNILIHVPHASTFIPDEHRRKALISQQELEAENRFMCDSGILDLISEKLRPNAVIFPYSRLYCDVERFRDGTEHNDGPGTGDESDIMLWIMLMMTSLVTLLIAHTLRRKEDH